MMAQQTAARLSGLIQADHCDECATPGQGVLGVHHRAQHQQGGRHVRTSYQAQMIFVRIGRKVSTHDGLGPNRIAAGKRMASMQ